MKQIVATLTLLLFSSIALADNCDSTRTTFDDVYCTNKLYADADRELNQNYQKLRGLLNTEQKTTLKRSQLAWIRIRDAQCVEGNSIDVGCRLSTTQDRNTWLRERLRECKTVGCMNSRLSD